MVSMSNARVCPFSHSVTSVMSASSQQSSLLRDNNIPTSPSTCQRQLSTSSSSDTDSAHPPSWISASESIDQDSPTMPSRNLLTSPSIATLEEMPVSQSVSVKRGFFSRFFSCGSGGQEEEVKRIPDEEDKDFYKVRIAVALGKEYKNVDAAIDMTIVGKITSKEGDSELVFVGDEIGKKLGYSSGGLLGKDISFLFSDPVLANAHKGYLAAFAEARLAPNRTLEQTQKDAGQLPVGDRNYDIKGKGGVTFDTTFKLNSFFVHSQNSTPKQKKYAGVYTFALFTIIKKGSSHSSSNNKDKNVVHVKKCPFAHG